LLEPWRVTHIQSYRFLRAAVLLRKGRTAEAVTLARATAESGMGLGSPFLDAIGHTLLGNLLMLDGQHAEARAHLQWALDLGRRMPSDNLKFQSLMPLAWCHLDAGEDEAGLACLREALAIGRRHSYKNCDPWWIPQVMSRLCARALDAGIEPDYVRRLIRLRGLAPPADCLDLEGWPWGVRIYTLGRFAVFIEGEPLRFSTKAQKRPLELLKALIALGGRGIGMEPLADQLWPSFEGDAGQNALQVALHRLRKLLGDKKVLDLQEGRLSFDPARLWVDAWAFERLTGKADTLVRARPKESAGRAPALAEALLGLYLGPFLHEEEAPWAIGQRERLHSKFLRTASALCALLEGAGQLAQAADMHRRALEVDPLAEEAHRGLMRCLQSAGRIAEALDAYRRCRHILSVTLGIAPSPETQALYRALKG
jgi:LuxR family maltose regulon positive regulatory protein